VKELAFCRIINELSTIYSVVNIINILPTEFVDKINKSIEISRCIWYDIECYFCG